MVAAVFVVELTEGQGDLVGGCSVTTGGPVLIDGQPARSVQLYLPYGLTSDLAGGIYCADSSASVIRRCVLSKLKFVASVLF
jgi:hypothetical protein